MILQEAIDRARLTGALPPAGLRNETTFAALIEAGMTIIRQDLHQAKMLARSAKKLASKLGDPLCSGQAARLQGHTELLAGRSKEALVHYAEARRAFRWNPLEKAATAVAMLQALAYVGDYEQAFSVAEEALATFREANDPIRAARVEANLANALHRLDRLEEAKEHFESARSVLAEAEMVADLAIVTRNYGVCLMGLLEFDEAEKLYKEAREFFEAFEQTSLIFEIDLNRAYLLGRQGRILQALEMYRDLRQDLPTELGFEIGHCFLDQADFLLEYGLWTDAREAAIQSGAIFEQLGARFELGKTKLLEGVAAIRQNHLDHGQSALKESRRLLHRDPNQNWRALLHGGFAELYRAQGRTKWARRELLTAEASNPNAERLPLLQNELADVSLELGDWTTFTRLPVNPALEAKFHRLRGDQAKAEESARLALTRYDSVRTGLETARLRQAAAQAQARELRECFRALQDPRERLEVVVRLKNQTLAELAHAPEAIPVATDEQSLREARIYQIRRFTPVDLPRVDPGERVIEFFADEGQLTAFVLLSTGIEEISLGPLDTFHKQVRLLRFQLGRDRVEGGQGALRVMNDLRQALSSLVGESDRVIIGRDPSLLTIPFSALFPERQLTLVPNVATWTVLKAHTAGGERVLVLGQADANAPLIESETHWVAEHFATQRVDLDEFEKLAPESRWIHLAAHGIAREDRPLLSSMKFGERSLAVLDVARSTFRAELVTLSGCSTGLSGVDDVQDVEGFIEAFLAAGAGAVLATLWEVSDEATYAFMKYFYSNRAAGLDQAFRTAVAETRASYPHPADWAGFAMFGRIF